MRTTSDSSHSTRYFFNMIQADLDPSTRPMFTLLSRVELQVINMICNIRDESPNNVAAELDDVLEALRSSELYAPHLLQHVRDDKVVNELVEGLMTVSSLLMIS